MQRDSRFFNGEKIYRIISGYFLENFSPTVDCVYFNKQIYMLIIIWIKMRLWFIKPVPEHGDFLWQIPLNRYILKNPKKRDSQHFCNGETTTSIRLILSRSFYFSSCCHFFQVIQLVSILFMFSLSLYWWVPHLPSAGTGCTWLSGVLLLSSVLFLI